MSERILIVTQHQKKYSKKQIGLLQSVHGSQKIVVDFDKTRFEPQNENHIKEFYDEKKAEGYAFIYFNITVKLKNTLKESGRIFGVVLTPVRKKDRTIFKIVHYVPGEDEERVVKECTIHKKSYLRGYRNQRRLVKAA